uniref:Uncharacterized protein n=1 Tax=Chromera velia CCMP2878 TaxID=1169474 RepID=A0A0G4G813_9ALVE|eukprot:Cvel_4314.t1-p1 / transcript=Cvel_4314.t1 / gene=Cvel_4314 / organism=Chromera_velia_CCMP2878 / gene_product=Zinc finger protein 345, putative / transcript_product=Zinc finger protein 345, putative / location=Cvel_scaffold187:24716-28090(+) / protein_length=153 / sequence_SO=supercontig / SO=protein_coding / is_pseudo=false
MVKVRTCSLIHGVAAVRTDGSVTIAKTAVGRVFVSMGAFEGSARSVVGRLFVSTVACGERAKSAVGRESAFMEKDARLVLTVEEVPCVAMDGTDTTVQIAVGKEFASTVGYFLFLPEPHSAVIVTSCRYFNSFPAKFTVDTLTPRLFPLYGSI